MSESQPPVVSSQQIPAQQAVVCANCGAPLTAKYCAACGQRHEPHVHTVRHFAAEAFESITHADSRLWRTLWYLLAKPGRLTLEFFQGHRVRYLPPFRLYLVISLVFFLVAGLPGAIKVDVEPSGAEQIQGTNDTAGAPENEPVEAPSGLQDQNLISEICKGFQKPDPKANREYARMHAFCSRSPVERTQAIGKATVDNLPRAMFVFLPLLALVMKLLYWRPKRYYVEHLLLLVHNHAFVFLALTIIYPLRRLPMVGEHLELLEFAVWLYIIWYIFRGMRVYYAQSRALTFGKYVAIGFAYFTTSLLVISLTSIFIAMTM